ncbi:PSP1-domain-containing protein [Metschnikowia bicuspidata var. bicuspidata NRRL YB-4993]|uniref:PSP1-domain-containing protein n=1 Tax=Metschnikowia bicuspidata var. bicuspidata NRRL YB-4993 TaxID=869754 RepID=A0A1A0HG52_9ASCO|nr:PSP1-domain-containing protein [Metschnikowia bicuspidata var. bicuspidata NRRL YB-4993]OBA22965.1 PSP1-domain-containing protein [Metschnikowia bicuspidata var. bicuspidata NRRL YB-4993]
MPGLPRDFAAFGAPFQNHYAGLDSAALGYADASPFDSFHLPQELQGGIGNISSRRPSYAAESFTRSGPAVAASPPNLPATSNKNSLASFAAANNYSRNYAPNAGYDLLMDSFGNFSLNSNLSDFQARRASQLVDFQPAQQGYYGPPMDAAPQPGGFLPYAGAGPSAARAHADPHLAAGFPHMGQPFHAVNAQQNYPMKLDNKLMLKNKHILSTAELKALYASVSRYYQDTGICQGIVRELHALLRNQAALNLVAFIKNLNNLNIQHKMLCLVINKNGKLDLLSYPNNSNIFLQNGDMVVVDGDRGKDLVMVLEPLVLIDMAILFNFLKKIEHLRSLTIVDSQGSSSVKNSLSSGTHSTDMDASAIVNTHLTDDNEFIINLPTKQVLRFATPKEIQKLSSKFLEEKKAFVTCFNKIKELNLSHALTLVNVEYQFDFKKLIFYYFANFKRIDFRDLIKELFKIYKTRIWLCAVLPYDQPELYTKNKSGFPDANLATGKIPQEYDLTTEKIMTFSIEDFNMIPSPSYFHLRNMANLVDNLKEDVKGKFYGFNKGPASAGAPAPEKRRGSYVIQPSFDPFGESTQR